MALSKVTYVNGQTVIGAANLNDIQDEIIANRASITTNASNIATNTSNIATNTSNIATNTSDIADLETVAFTSYGTINAGTTKAITVPNSFRGIIFLFRGSSTMAAYMVTSASTGNTYAAPLVEGLNVTVTTATNRVTVQNSGTANLYTYYIGNNILS